LGNDIWNMLRVGGIFPPIGRCIYCNSQFYAENEPSRGLATEHIIPEGLGGNILLPKASCKKCEAATCSFEGSLQRGVLGHLRVHLNSPTKRPKDRPTELPVIVISADGMERIEMVPVVEHPLMCMMVKMNPPKIVARADGGDRIVIGKYLQGRDKFEKLTYNLTQKFKSRVEVQARVGYRELCLQLAKIAHGLTVIGFGQDKYDDYLLDKICRKDHEALGLYVGSARGEITDKFGDHHIDCLYYYKGKQRYIVWRISLFGSLDFPTYDVISGRSYEAFTKPEGFERVEVFPAG